MLFIVPDPCPPGNFNLLYLLRCGPGEFLDKFGSKAALFYRKIEQ
jgi:hypothetical protein